MKDIVENIFKEFKNVNWFSNCGNSNLKFNSSAFKQVNSFENFVENVNSLEWENIQLEASNRLTFYLHNKRVKQYENDHNSIVREIKSRLDFVTDLNEQFKKEYSLDIKDTLQWDILFYSLERYYMNFNKHIPLFYNNVMDIYREGNFPCGFTFYKDLDFSSGGEYIYF